MATCFTSISGFVPHKWRFTNLSAPQKCTHGVAVSSSLAPSTIRISQRQRSRGGIRATTTEKGESEKGSSKQQLLEFTFSAREELTPELARELYEDMYLGREFEERCAEMYYRGKMFGFVHLYSGQEAVSTGVISCLNKDDFVCSTYRDHVHALSKGVPARDVMAELFGKQTGICRGQGGSMHMFSSQHNFLGGYAFIGEGIPVGVGAAFQTKYRKATISDVLKDDSATQVTCSFFGDGTCNNGQFYECLNLAGLYKLPHIFVVENNLWAIGMYHNRATAKTKGDEIPYIYKKGSAFGFEGVLVDGMDVQKVREVALKAVEKARNGGGPTLIECETYRFRGHSLADPDELRDKKEKAMYQARDPIPKFRTEALEAKILKKSDFEEIEKRVKEIVEEAIDYADKSPKPVPPQTHVIVVYDFDMQEQAQLLENVFADPKGFGIAEDGRYHFEKPGFTSGNAQIS